MKYQVTLSTKSKAFHSVVEASSPAEAEKMARAEWLPFCKRPASVQVIPVA